MDTSTEYICTLATPIRGLFYPILSGQLSQICGTAVRERGSCHSFLFRLSPVSGLLIIYIYFLLRIECF